MENAPTGPNLKAIADRVGVSKATVSRALRGLPGHKQVTRDKILKVAKEMGYEPDCILGTGRELPRKLKELGLDDPQRMGFVHLGWHPSYEGLAGINPHWDQTGRTAVNVVVDQMNRNDFGLPAFPLWTLIDGEWIEGGSVRPTAEAEAPASFEI